MSTSYNRDAFADLMSELAAQARITGGPAYKGGNKEVSGGTSGGDFLQNLADAGAFGGPAPVGPTVQTGPGFSVGSFGSTASLPTSTAPTPGFSIGSDSRMGTSINAVPFTSDIGDYGFTTEGTGLSSLVADAVGGLGPFQPLGRLYPGDIGYYPGLDPDSGYAAQGFTINPVTKKSIDLSKYGQGEDTAASTTGALPISTGSAGGANEVVVTGQQGSGAGLTPASLTGGAGLGANTNIAGEVTATGTRPDEDTVDLNAGLTATAIDPNIAGETLVTAKRPDEEQDNKLLDVLSTATGLPINQVFSFTKKIKDAGLTATAIDALGLDNITKFLPDETGNTYVDNPYDLLMGDTQGVDMSGMNDNTTAGAGGGDFAIPQRTAIRSVVPGTYDPNRRAGSGGQRYFSDMQYVPNVADPAAQKAANLAAQGQTNAQAMLLAYQNAQNPARQTAPGATAVSLEDRVAALLGQSPVSQTGAGLAPAAATTDTAATSNAELEELVQTINAGASGTATGAITGATTDTTGATTDTTGATTDTTGATTGTASPYTYTSESLFQGIDPSDGFDETEIGRVASLMNQDYTTADQVSEFFNMSPDDVNRYLGDYNTRATLLDSLGLAEGQTSLNLDQLNQLGDSGLATDYLASTFGVGEDVLSRAIEGAQTDRTLSGVNTVGGISRDDQNIIADLLTSGKTDIGNVAGKYGVEGMDVVEGLLRGGYETPAEMAARLAPQNEGLTEVDLVANLLNTGRAQPEEIASYYRNTDPEQFADLTAAGVEAELAKINEQKTSDYLTGLSDEEVGALINSGDLTVGQAVGFYQDRYPGLSAADVNASMKAMGYAQGGNVQGYYLGGPTDGMADQIPATINNMQPAALSDGEFVIPADVVSHLGNGNSDSGAKELYGMMDRIRQDRTGTTKQGRQIDPNKYLA